MAKPSPSADGQGEDRSSRRRLLAARGESYGPFGRDAFRQGKVFGRMRIVMNSDPRLLHILRGAVRLRVQASGLPAGAVESLTMAIDEAASNVIRHAYGNRSDGRLALEIRSFPDRLEFVLEDSGCKVRPEQVCPRDLNELRPGGLGTLFIRRFMDEVCYESCDPNGNRLRLVKHLPRKATTVDQDSGSKDR